MVRRTSMAVAWLVIAGWAAAQDATTDGVPWDQIPRVRPTPPLGFYRDRYPGPGYYSLLDRLRGNFRQAPPQWPYPRFGVIPQSFFDADNFSYLDDPNNIEFDYTDPLHRVRHKDWLYVTGGEARGRYENRINDQLSDTDNVFGLGRLRTYHDLWYRDDFRFFVEGIFAASAWQDLPPLSTDQNRADFLNLFVEVKVADAGGDPAYVRVGRQEMLFGSQRLISTLDWVNTRRTFDGVRGFRRAKDWDFDAFWAQPVIPNAARLDSVDNNQNFAGLWLTHRPKADHTADAYYLVLDNTNNAVQLGIPRSPVTVHTAGGRYVGSEGGFLFDAEAAVQLGTLDRRNVIAGMATAGVGGHWEDAPCTPTAWAYYDYASGGGADRGTAHTFNQLFPFGHYYFGWLDQVGRQNIHDLNFHLYLYPTKWMTGWVQFHSFWLDSPSDALYNASGDAYRRDPTGRAGRHVGEELDLICNFQLSDHLHLLTGYSYLWGGNFLRNTAGPGAAADCSFYYCQLSYRW